MKTTRSSGILLHISSLPSPYGIGDLGREAYKFIDFLKKAGQTFWQILPTNPTSYGDSPYQALSTFAGNHYFIDVEELVGLGWLTWEELQENWGDNPAMVDYGIQFEKKTALLRKAYDRFGVAVPDNFAEFCKKESKWLEDYCLFRAIKSHFGGKAWQEWEDGLKFREEKALDKYRKKLAKEMDFHRFLQYCFFAQWKKLQDYAHANGIKIIGDVPIYVPLDSVDVWANPEKFQLTKNLKPKVIAGCPPDVFNRDGQYWGHPIYDWDYMEKNQFAWWVDRIGGAARLYDVIRIDHFRGIESYFSIPGRNKTARVGRWIPGPGMKLVKMLQKNFPETEFIAEDLGFLTDDVRKLVIDSGFPGMKVLEFAFDDDTTNEYLPHHYIKNCVCYTGTHDNDTLAHWIETRTEEQLDFIREYLGLREDDDLRVALLETGMQSDAVWFVALMQDWLNLDGSARMNEPGKALPTNWRWRMLPGAATDELAAWILEMTNEGER